MKAETIVAQPSTCPDCGSSVSLTGKHIHHCISAAELAAGLHGDYVALFDGKLVALRPSKSAALAALNDYCFDLVADGLIEGNVFEYLPDVVIPEAAFCAAAIRDMEERKAA